MVVEKPDPRELTVPPQNLARPVMCLGGVEHFGPMTMTHTLVAKKDIWIAIT